MDKKQVSEYLRSKMDLFGEISDTIFDHPETLFTETVSAQALCKALEDEGFVVERGLGGMETAFAARFGSGKPVIGFLGEYDALFGMAQDPGVAKQQAADAGGKGHGCGHNLLGVGSLAAAFGLKKYMEETGTKGTIVYMGCPAEEGGSGKAFMAREGLFSELDCALSWHPGDANSVIGASTLANYQVNYRFKGVSAHAAATPHLGRSALDAVELMNMGVQFLREHVIQEARIHYAITNTGGLSPNVVQQNAEVLYLIRAPKSPDVADLYERINKIARGAAMMTETEVEIEFVKGCSNTVPNSVLESLLYENMLASEALTYTEEELAFAREMAETTIDAGAKVRAMINGLPEGALSQERIDEILAKADDPLPTYTTPYFSSNAVLPASSDVGDASWNCPTAQFSTATWVAGTAAHTWQAVAVGKTGFAKKAAVRAGEIMAGAAIDLLNSPEKVEKAKQELEKRLGGAAYVCPIPKEISFESLKRA